MSYGSIAQWIGERVEELVALGVSREVAEREMKGVEWAAVKDLAEAHHDNQLLLTFEQYGSEACAKRYGVSPRTVRDWRKEALNRKQRRRLVAVSG
jgi:hypothetical protein